MDILSYLAAFFGIVMIVVFFDFIVGIFRGDHKGDHTGGNPWVH
jgi:hypothetical protein